MTAPAARQPAGPQSQGATVGKDIARPLRRPPAGRAGIQRAGVQAGTTLRHPAASIPACSLSPRVRPHARRARQFTPQGAGQVEQGVAVANPGVVVEHGNDVRQLLSVETVEPVGRHHAQKAGRGLFRIAGGGAGRGRRGGSGLPSRVTALRESPLPRLGGRALAAFGPAGRRLPPCRPAVGILPHAILLETVEKPFPRRRWQEPCSARAGKACPVAKRVREHLFPRHQRVGLRLQFLGLYHRQPALVFQDALDLLVAARTLSKGLACPLDGRNMAQVESEAASRRLIMPVRPSRENDSSG